MNEKTKKTGIIIAIILFLLMFIGNVFLINKVMNQDEKFDRYEQSISALSDSVHHSIKNGLDVYSQKAPEIAIKDLVNSEYFKTLSAEQQKFYNDLKNIKGLIAATKIELEKQGHLLDEINKGTIETDSTGKQFIKFALNDSLNFHEKDLNKKFQWTSKVLLSKPVKFEFDYTYKPTITTTFERQKDKTIVVNYAIDDPDLKANKIQNFIIPIEEDKRGPLAKWLNKNKAPIITIGAVGVFGAGIYTGIKLAK